MDELRPEYVNAVEAALWNYWFILAYLLPFLILLPLGWKRSHRILTAIGAVLSLAICWLCYAKGIRYMWYIREINAQTEAEWADVTADTAKLFAPIIIGIPFAVGYTLLSLLVSEVLRVTAQHNSTAKQTQTTDA